MSDQISPNACSGCGALECNSVELWMCNGSWYCNFCWSRARTTVVCSVCAYQVSSEMKQKWQWKQGHFFCSRCWTGLGAAPGCDEDSPWQSRRLYNDKELGRQLARNIARQEEVLEQEQAAADNQGAEQQRPQSSATRTSVEPEVGMQEFFRQRRLWGHMALQYENTGGLFSAPTVDAALSSSRSYLCMMRGIAELLRECERQQNEQLFSLFDIRNTGSALSTPAAEARETSYTYAALPFYKLQPTQAFNSLRKMTTSEMKYSDSQLSHRALYDLIVNEKVPPSRFISEWIRQADLEKEKAVFGTLKNFENYVALECYERMLWQWSVRLANMHTQELADRGGYSHCFHYLASDDTAGTNDLQSGAHSCGDPRCPYLHCPDEKRKRSWRVHMCNFGINCDYGPGSCKWSHEWKELRPVSNVGFRGSRNRFINYYYGADLFRLELRELMRRSLADTALWKALGWQLYPFPRNTEGVLPLRYYQQNYAYAEVAPIKGRDEVGGEAVWNASLAGGGGNGEWKREKCNASRAGNTEVAMAKGEFSTKRASTAAPAAAVLARGTDSDAENERPESESQHCARSTAGSPFSSTPAGAWPQQLTELPLPVLHDGPSDRDCSEDDPRAKNEDRCGSASYAGVAAAQLPKRSVLEVNLKREDEASAPRAVVGTGGLASATTSTSITTTSTQPALQKMTTAAGDDRVLNETSAISRTPEPAPKRGEQRKPLPINTFSLFRRSAFMTSRGDIECVEVEQEDDIMFGRRKPVKGPSSFTPMLKEIDCKINEDNDEDDWLFGGKKCWCCPVFGSMQLRTRHDTILGYSTKDANVYEDALPVCVPFFDEYYVSCAKQGEARRLSKCGEVVEFLRDNNVFAQFDSAGPPLKLTCAAVRIFESLTSNRYWTDYKDDALLRPDVVLIDDSSHDKARHGPVNQNIDLDLWLSNGERRSHLELLRRPGHARAASSCSSENGSAAGASARAQEDRGPHQGEGSDHPSPFSGAATLAGSAARLRHVVDTIFRNYYDLAHDEIASNDAKAVAAAAADRDRDAIRSKMVPLERNFILPNKNFLSQKRDLHFWKWPIVQRLQISVYKRSGVIDVRFLSDQPQEDLTLVDAHCHLEIIWRKLPFRACERMTDRLLFSFHPESPYSLPNAWQLKTITSVCDLNSLDYWEKYIAELEEETKHRGRGGGNTDSGWTASCSTTSSAGGNSYTLDAHLYFSIGVHPKSFVEYMMNERGMQTRLHRLADKLTEMGRLVAWGEIGLDYDADMDVPACLVGPEFEDDTLLEYLQRTGARHAPASIRSQKEEIEAGQAAETGVVSTAGAAASAASSLVLVEATGSDHDEHEPQKDTPARAAPGTSIRALYNAPPAFRKKYFTALNAMQALRQKIFEGNLAWQLFRTECEPLLFIEWPPELLHLFPPNFFRRKPAPWAKDISDLIRYALNVHQHLSEERDVSACASLRDGFAKRALCSGTLLADEQDVQAIYFTWLMTNVFPTGHRMWCDARRVIRRVRAFERDGAEKFLDVDRRGNTRLHRAIANMPAAQLLRGLPAARNSSVATQVEIVNRVSKFLGEQVESLLQEISTIPDPRVALDVLKFCGENSQTPLELAGDICGWDSGVADKLLAAIALCESRVNAAAEDGLCDYEDDDLDSLDGFSERELTEFTSSGGSSMIPSIATSARTGAGHAGGQEESDCFDDGAVRNSCMIAQPELSAVAEEDHDHEDSNTLAAASTAAPSSKTVFSSHGFSGSSAYSPSFATYDSTSGQNQSTQHTERYEDRLPQRKRVAMRNLFREQLREAKRRNLPVVLHSRGADLDCIKILQEELPKTHKAHMHCWSSGTKFLKKLMTDFPGMMIGVAGHVTTGSAKTWLVHPFLNDDAAYENLRDAIVENVPLDRLLVETDAPYMPPVMPEDGSLSYDLPAMSALPSMSCATVRYLVEMYKQKNNRNQSRNDHHCRNFYGYGYRDRTRDGGEEEKQQQDLNIYDMLRQLRKNTRELYGI